MKIRASVGLLGNDAVSPYAFLSTYNLMDGNKNAYQTILNGKVMQALRASVIANPTLTWENTLTYNAGFDLRCGMVCWEWSLTHSIIIPMIFYSNGRRLPPIYGRILLYLCQL